MKVTEIVGEIEELLSGYDRVCKKHNYEEQGLYDGVDLYFRIEYESGGDGTLEELLKRLREAYKNETI